VYGSILESGNISQSSPISQADYFIILDQNQESSLRPLTIEPLRP